MQEGWHNIIKKFFWGAANVPAILLVTLIVFYQKTLSPDHGFLSVFFPNGCCRFYPSCSEYSKKALEKHGFFKGTFLSCWRVLRCNPWSEGGIDEVV